MKVSRFAIWSRAWSQESYANRCKAVLCKPLQSGSLRGKFSKAGDPNVDFQML